MKKKTDEEEKGEAVKEEKEEEEGRRRWRSHGNVKPRRWNGSFLFLFLEVEGTKQNLIHHIRHAKLTAAFPKSAGFISFTLPGKSPLKTF